MSMGEDGRGRSEAALVSADSTETAQQSGAGLTAAAGAWVGAHRYPLVAALASRAAVYVLVAMVGWTTRLPKGAGFSYRAFFGPLGLWDARWYHWIAAYGYDPLLAHGNTVAFFPLLPAVWRGLMIIPLPATLTASVFSSVCFVAAAVVIHGLTRRRFDERVANATVLLLSFFPTSFVYSMPYAESAFLLATALAFDAMERRRMPVAVAWAAIAITARPVGIFLIPALVIAGARRSGLRSRAALLPVAALAGVEAGVLAYLGWRTGDAYASGAAEHRGWNRHLTDPVTFVWHTLTNDVAQGHHLSVLLDLGFLAFWIVLLVALWRLRVPAEYVVYSALTILVPVADGSLLSIGRLGMVAFPLFWGLAVAAARSERRLLVAGMASSQLLCAVVYLALGARSYVP